MTILTKTSIVFSKPDRREPTPGNNDDNTVVCFEDEDKLDIGWIDYQQLSNRFASKWIMFLMLLLLVLTVALGGVLLYRQCVYVPNSHRYQGFCSIPIRKDNREVMSATEGEELSYRATPLRWVPEPDVQVFATLEEPVADDAVSFLREQLDIGDMLERISVYDNGKQINFIHDFSSNQTGIADGSRCFVMELDRSSTLSPEVFALSLERGAALETAVVRSVWRAMLPPLRRAAAAWAAPVCDEKPVYTLQREDVVIRKRSPSEPAHEFMQFSGKHVQAIAIDNLAELLDYEKKLKSN